MKAIAAFPVILTLGAIAVVLALPKHYDATAVVQIDPRQKSQAAMMLDDIDATLNRQPIEAELGAVRSGPVIRRAIETLHLDNDPEFKPSWPNAWLFALFGTPDEAVEAAVLKHIVVARLRNTLMITIAASASNPAKAARIANAVADAYLTDWTEGKSSLETAETMMGQRSKDDLDGDGKISESERVFGSLLTQYGQSLEAPGPRLLARATPPPDAAHPNIPLTAATTFALALVTAIAAALLLELKSSASAQRVEMAFACRHMTSFPAIPEHGGTPARDCRFVLAEPAGTYAEAVRKTCRELEKRRGGALSRLTLVVSAVSGEGAECLASNIAHQYAAAGHFPLLIDADLRMGTLTRQLAGQSPSGLLDQIANRKPVESAILRDSGTGLHFLPACGQAPIPLPVRDILRSKAFAQSMAQLKQSFVTIIMSAPPLLNVDDAHLLADLDDDIVFVTAWHKTPKRLARQALATLTAHQGKLVGAALTDVVDRADDAMMSLRDVIAEMRAVAPLAPFKPRAA